MGTLGTRDTLDYIARKWGLNTMAKPPIEIPDVGRDDLARLFAELGFAVGIEIGVDQGAFSEVLCRENPQAIVFGVDAWHAYKGYREHLNQDRMDGLYEIARKRLEPYSNYRLVRKMSMEAVSDFKDRSLDFVYIDSNHDLRYVVDDLTEWSRKVRTGGIVSGHDYRQSVNDFPLHVVQAVNAFTDAYRIRPWFLLGTKAVVVGQTRERSRSWFWVKV